MLLLIFVKCNQLVKITKNYPDQKPMFPIEIAELSTLAFRDELSVQYIEKHGFPPYDLSHWDPSEETVEKLLPSLNFPNPQNVLTYIFSYDLDDTRAALLNRLGFSETEQDVLIVPTGTSAIAFTAWWLRCQGIEQVIVLCPAYFSSFYALDLFEITYKRLYLTRRSGEWELPYESIIKASKNIQNTAIWITNPIYTTGVYLGSAEVAFVNSLIDHGVTVIADECHAIPGMEITPKLHQGKHLVGICSPHKSVCINAAKFGAVIFEKSFDRFFAEWTDILIGGLSVSNYSAVLHFLSQNFSTFQRAFNGRIEKAREIVKTIIAEVGGGLEIDSSSTGYLMSCYLPRLATPDNCDEVLRSIIFNAGVTVIPGIRNHFDPELGFNFRINLARLEPQFISGLHRAAHFLSKL